MVHGRRLDCDRNTNYKEGKLIMESLTRSQERKINDLYDKVFIHGTRFKTLLDVGFTLKEINHVLVKGGLKPITKRGN